MNFTINFSERFRHETKRLAFAQRISFLQYYGVFTVVAAKDLAEDLSVRKSGSKPSPALKIFCQGNKVCTRWVV